MTWIEIITITTSMATILFALGKLIYIEVKGRVNNRNFEIKYNDTPQIKDGALCDSATISVYNKMCKPALITEISLFNGNQTIYIATNNSDGVFEWIIPSGVRLTAKFILDKQPTLSNCELKFVINGEPLSVKVTHTDFRTIG